MSKHETSRLKTVIAANQSKALDIKELWRYRELLFFLTWRDILVKYKQTVIGITWSFIRPVLTMIIFTIVFNKLAKLPAQGDIPYALMVFAALLPWQFFSSAVAGVSESIVINDAMITKIYFPRILLPLSAALVLLIEFFITLFLYFILIIYYQFFPDIRILFLPLFLLMAILTVLGLGLFFACMNVSYRDFRQITPFILQVGLYASPVGFSSAIVPEQWLWLYYVNPMVAVIEGFRWCLLGLDTIYWPGVGISVGMICLMLIISLRAFQQTQAKFADRI